jgi:hypothetical protein
MAVLGLFTPYAVVVEVFIADSSASDVARGEGTVFSFVADRAPAIEAVIGRRLGDRMRHRSAVCEFNLLVGLDAHGWPLASGVAFALADRNYGGIAVGVDIETVHAGLLNRERGVRRVDLVNFAAKEMADMEVKGPLVQFNLDGAIAHVRQGQTGFIAHAQDAGADVQFRARFFVSPHVVGDRQRSVQASCNPILGATRLNGNGSRHVLQTRRSSRGIILIRLRRRARLLILYRLLILCRLLIWILFLVLRPRRNCGQ